MSDSDSLSKETTFTTPCELPTPYEREVLTILIEEAAEVQQCATKLLRFGRDEIQPGQGLSNKERLSDEVGDLLALVEVALDAGLIEWAAIEDRKAVKFRKLAKYMQTSKARGEDRSHEGK